MSGWLCSLELWGGWPLAFYLFGGLGLVWYVFWLIFIYDTPSQHASIDPSEKAYIEASVEKKDEVSITRLIHRYFCKVIVLDLMTE